MASENSKSNAGDDGETGSSSDPREHDYAHSTASNFTSAEGSSSGAPAADGGVPQQVTYTVPLSPADSLTIELPEPSVGAEVDCPGGNEEADGPDGNDMEAASLPPPPRAEDVPPIMKGGRRRARRPEDKNCCCCKYTFERQGRSFNRRAVYTFTTPETVQWAFPGAVAHSKSFLCETCAQVIRTKCKRKNTGKRSVWLKPPVTKQSNMRDKSMKGFRMGKKSKAALLVSKSCYKAAFKMLWSAKGARKPMMDFLSKELKEEMKALSRQADSPFHQKVSSKKPLASFPWTRCLNWAQEKAPLVTTCLRSLFPTINALVKSSHQLTEEQAQILVERRTMLALSIPLFTRNIWKNNFLQAALGAELRLQGCSGSALDTLNTLGLCQNKDTVRLRLHRIHSSKKSPTENGQQMMKMKPEQMEEEQMSDIEDEEDEEDEEEVEDQEDDEEEEEEEVQDAVQEEEDEDQEVEENVEMEKMRRKKAKKQRKEEKKRERGKRKGKQREEEELEEDDEGSEQKKRRVVVVRLGLLKGHSEVGRSDLSAP
ncbi:uncharacterized protein ACBR49_013631 [Aulostomus maculatus]